MTEQHVDRMRDQVISRTRVYALLFIAITVCFIFKFDDEIANLTLSYDNFNINSITTIRVIHVIIAFFVTAIITFTYDARLQFLLDKYSYKMLGQVNEVIETELVAGAEVVGIRDAARLREDKEKIQQLFYHFANRQDVLRSRSFSCWTTYLVNIKVIFIGALCIFIMFLYMIVSHDYARLLISPIIILFIALYLHYNTGGTLAKKMLGVPKDQIAEILASEREAFKTQILNRFGS